MMVIYVGYTACFDGASRGNPGDAGAGAAICNESGETVWELARYLGKKTNNEAEYTALILLLEEIKDRGLKEVAITGDSKLVVNQVNRLWKVNKPHLKDLFKRALELKEETASSISWVPREQNAHADLLSNKAFDEKSGVRKMEEFEVSKLEKVGDSIFIAHGKEDYAVDIAHGNCSCPSFRRNKDCKHLRAARSVRK
jgi:ribonuclease HI